MSKLMLKLIVTTVIITTRKVLTIVKLNQINNNVSSKVKKMWKMHVK